MADWTRRPFTGIGLTQVPAGRYLGALQARYGGTVMLCIDASGSMDGAPFLEALRGAKTFVDEAVGVHYAVGVMLWDTQVVALAEPTTDGKAARRVLAQAKRPSGGTRLLGPLIRCHEILDHCGHEQDRVVALFCDGDLTPRDRVLARVKQMKAEGIRFVTRGLGADAARAIGEISSEEPGSAHVAGVDDLAAGIAGMAATLKSENRLA